MVMIWKGDFLEVARMVVTWWIAAFFLSGTTTKRLPLLLLNSDPLIVHIHFCRSGFKKTPYSTLSSVTPSISLSMSKNWRKSYDSGSRKTL